MCSESLLFVHAVVEEGPDDICAPYRFTYGEDAVPE
jgi:hypothetical protein